MGTAIRVLAIGINYVVGVWYAGILCLMLVFFAPSIDVTRTLGRTELAIVLAILVYGGAWFLYTVKVQRGLSKGYLLPILWSPPVWLYVMASNS